MYSCGKCGKRACTDGRELPGNCPGRDEEIAKRSKEAYKGEDRRIAEAASQVEYEGYLKRTRVEEIMEFAEKMGWRKIGIAHCIGLKAEAGAAQRIFEANGFEVDSVCCKGGSFKKSEMGLEAYTFSEGEIMCNPVGQAAYLEKAGCELAVIMGLCVGHDTLFMKHCKLPMTYLVVKDRVLAHNPAAALYQEDGYMHKKLYPPTRLKGDLNEGPKNGGQV